MRQLQLDEAERKRTLVGAASVPMPPPGINHSLRLHKFFTLQVLVALVGSPHAGAVHAPTLLGVVALLGPEFAIVLTIRVIDAIVVHEGGLVRLSSQSTGVQVLPGSVHLGLHQEAFGDH